MGSLINDAEVKAIWDKMQHGFTEGRPCQTLSISFFEKVTMRAAGEVFPVKIGKHSCLCTRPR